MSVIGDFIVAIAKMLNLVVDMYTFIVVIAVIMTWFRPDPNNPIVRIIYQLTDPAFKFVRSFLPRVFFRTGMDFSPIAVLLLLIFIESFLIKQIFKLGHSMM